MSSFISKPSSGWIHSDKVIYREGASYSVRYVGCIQVKESMKKLDFKTRSNVAKVCISKVSESAGLKPVDKKRKIDKKVLRAIDDVPIMRHSGANVTLNISSFSLTLKAQETGLVIASHDMPRISFASGGDTDTLDFVAYIAKDAKEWRACYVLECGGGLAKDVISTIGQAFELRYKQYCKPSPAFGLAAMRDPNSASGGDADKDYYNDLPGKVPPDVGLPPNTCPPPVPPLPTVVQPFTTLPSVQTPNLIDLNSDLPPQEVHHDYVNDSVALTKDRDLFDMQPFTQHQLQPKKFDPGQYVQLRSEIWFHGQISRSEAERRLLKDGDFLVRESPSSEGQFVLSGMQDNTKKHLLLIDPEGVVRTKDRMFNSVSHLINFHCQQALPIISTESVLVLRTPVPNTS